ncbi:RNA-binding S4 domain-containing protein [bacterium]|nr:RNA-binding S4 domain-containing protein [bacterium]
MSTSKGLNEGTPDFEPIIRLGQFLKLTGFVRSGGEGKALILDGLVKVNGSVCLQRGKQLSLQDVVEVEGEVFSVADYL